MTENQILHQVVDERVYQPMITEIDAANIELALRYLIEKNFGRACSATLEGRDPRVVERLEREYEQSCDTYRRIVGKEPTAS